MHLKDRVTEGKFTAQFLKYNPTAGSPRFLPKADRQVTSRHNMYLDCSGFGARESIISGDSTNGLIKWKTKQGVLSQRYSSMSWLIFDTVVVIQPHFTHNAIHGGQMSLETEKE
jgi:hypothetical protein